jgi:DNA mismatch repair protein MutS2
MDTTHALQISDDNLNDLGWPRIKQALADRASTEPGRDHCMEIPFLPQDKVEHTLSTVHELMTLLTRGGDLPVTGTRDIRAAIARASRGAILDIDELVAIARTAEAGHLTRRHLLHHTPAFPRLGAEVGHLPDLTSLARELGATFDEAGKIRDDASPELAAARNRLISLHRNVKERLETFLTRNDLEGVLQDNYYTQREDRYVVPVISSFQKDVPGIIHGTSNSGETVFVEPGEFIEANNAIKVADAQVRLETERVLRIRSEWVAAEAPELSEAFDALVKLDALQARARLASDLDANVPRFSTDGEIRLTRARNPHLLLKGSHVIPNDIKLAPTESFLVVTGPNTGGKTVTLSTVGTFVLMLSAGCPIPAGEDSVIAPFDSLATLIGDSQDIQRDLSTFSGHLLAIHAILDAAQPGALVLLDEIIIGTEPTQGAALAIAVLESLASRGARGFVTTHYERLKTLPFEDPRFANASVGIDPVTQAPNFVLTSGRPGSSNPFDVALRLGFPAHLVQRAREVAGGHSSLSEALERLRAFELKAEQAEAAARAARDAAATEQAKLQLERQRLRREARAEVEALYSQARERIRELLVEIREKKQELPERLKDARGAADAQKQLHKLQDDLKAALPPDEDAPVEAKKTPDGPKDGGDLKPGEARPGLQVWIRSLGKVGDIVELRGERATVSVGMLKTTVHTADLGRVAQPRPPKSDKPIERPSERPARDADKVDRRARLTELPEEDERVPPPRTDDITADLRGARRDEVIERVEPLLDRAYRANIEAVWIIHGHGTGAIRDEVRELLARSPQVIGFRRGRRHEGGDGVTIAFLARE